MPIATPPACVPPAHKPATRTIHYTAACTVDDAMVGILRKAKGRRGARIGTVNMIHPDAGEFIRSRRRDGRLLREPSPASSRNVILGGRKRRENVDVFSCALPAYRRRLNPQAMPFAAPAPARLSACFVAADDTSPMAHVDIQVAAHHRVDSAIPKTANVPID
ncbi:hypothetical protein [Stenotrophomonas sp. BIGb0135]|jgi:ribonucleoside-diphosphate reductase alpha chain|uniref:hypothetical protein n=1 Tax=Stenotrophomonas sp. BIGb0135 TaxID=2940620 RepID=UPI00216A1CD4|nr:hypothetical protein [Stenotrophomonas sp. BIGb0135]MCS4234991.1 ribonucleotide reductase alpha subunit [Stenotrophomonas sp. BIGb0135]